MYKRDLSKPLASTFGDPPKKKKSFGVLKSDTNKPKKAGPKNLDMLKVKKLNSEIARVVKSFDTEERRFRARGNADFSEVMKRYSKEATKINKELIKLTGKGSSLYESKRKR